jgi:5-methylcytosine-specific restriction endonuclease McrA
MYYRQNRLRLVDASKRYYRRNRDKILLSTRRYRQNNREKLNKIYHVKTLRRRARKLSLPDIFTGEQWQYAVGYFNGCCAACGRQGNDLFGTHTLAADHWIPLSHPDCLGTVAWNIIPLCHGEGGCNNSKNDKLPGVWLRENFTDRENMEIMSRTIAYFNDVRERFIPTPDELKKINCEGLSNSALWMLINEIRHQTRIMEKRVQDRERELGQMLIETYTPDEIEEIFKEISQNSTG